MPMTCSICKHPARPEIDAALVAGTAVRDIAGQHDLGKSSVDRHASKCLPAGLVKGQEAKEEARGLDVLRQLRDINTACWETLAAARKGGELALTLQAVDRIQRQLELQAKLLGVLQQEGTVNVILAPEWQQTRTLILVALTPYPEARQAVAAALVEAEHARG